MEGLTQVDIDLHTVSDQACYFLISNSCTWKYDLQYIQVSVEPVHLATAFLL